MAPLLQYNFDLLWPPDLKTQHGSCSFHAGTCIRVALILRFSENWLRLGIHQMPEHGRALILKILSYINVVPTKESWQSLAKNIAP